MHTPNYCDLPLSKRSIPQAFDCVLQSTTGAFSHAFQSPASATIGEWGIVAFVVIVVILIVTVWLP